MKEIGRLFWMVVGVALGSGATLYLASTPRALAYNDRVEDFIMCTGAVQLNPQITVDGVWLLDYRAGRLLGTVIDRSLGKIVSWAEVDLVKEFGIPPRQNVHFLMTTGSIADGQAALYVAETSTGRFGVYTMGPRPDNVRGIAIRRHDQTYFRNQAGQK